MKLKLSLCMLALSFALLLVCTTACNSSHSGPKPCDPVESATLVKVAVTKLTDVANHNIYDVPKKVELAATVTNGSSFPVDKMTGTLSLFTQTGDLICSLQTPSSGWTDIKNGESESFVLIAKGLPSAMMNELYYTHAEDLTATFEISSISFRQYDSYGDYKVIPAHETPPKHTATVSLTHTDSIYTDERDFRLAAKKFANGDYGQALTLFEKIPEDSNWRYKSTLYENRCRGYLNDYARHKIYEEAQVHLLEGRYPEAYTAFKSIKSYLDTEMHLASAYGECMEQTQILAKSGKYTEALTIFDVLEIDKESDRYKAYAYASVGNFHEALAKGLTVVVLPEGMDTIPDGYFEGQDKLQTVVISSTTQKIGKNAFKGCSKLKEIHLPNHVKAIGDSAFEGCTSLPTINFPYELETVGSSAFRGCTALTRIDTNYSASPALTAIGSYAFADCVNLTVLNPLYTVKTIGEGAFENCSSLNSITLSNSLSVLSAKAFKGCSSLYDISIPENVTTIGAECFAGCTSLRTVTFEKQSQWTSSSRPDGVGFSVSDSQEMARFLTSEAGYCDAEWTQKK